MKYLSIVLFSSALLQVTFCQSHVEETHEHHEEHSFVTYGPESKINDSVVVQGQVQNHPSVFPRPPIFFFPINPFGGNFRGQGSSVGRPDGPGGSSGRPGRPGGSSGRPGGPGGFEGFGGLQSFGGLGGLQGFGGFGGPQGFGGFGSISAQQGLSGFGSAIGQQGSGKLPGSNGQQSTGTQASVSVAGNDSQTEQQSFSTPSTNPTTSASIAVDF